MKILCVADIHGKNEYIVAAYNKFLDESYDQIIFMGDYTDSFDRKNDQIINCFEQIHAIKEKHQDNCILLLGNHDIQYLYFPDYRCSGFRPELQPTITELIKQNESKYQVCYQIDKDDQHYLFSHAGVCRKWYKQNIDTIESIASKAGLDINASINLSSIFNTINETHDRKILHSVGAIRGGWGKQIGGLTWCDKNEMLSYGPLIGFHQIVGHTPQPFIQKVEKFEGDKHYENTSVTFIDVFNMHEQKTKVGFEVEIPFYTLEL